MLENLINLVKEQAGAAIVNHTAIPNEHNEAATQAASASLIDVFKDKISSGNFSELGQLFQGDERSTIVDQVKNSFSEKLGGLGIDSGAANDAASGIIPNLLSSVVSKFNEGGEGLNIQGLLSQFAGEDGKFDMGDVMNLFGGNKNEGGGIAGALKNLF